jgi:hypothetical protein
LQHLAYAALLTVAGCWGAKAPPAERPADQQAELPALEAGAEGVLVGAPFIKIWPTRKNVKWAKRDEEFAKPFVMAGAKVVIVEKDPGGGKPDRRVLVRLTSGERQGKSYAVERQSIKAEAPSR